MPYLNLITNVKVADGKAFAVEFSKLGAEALGKPQEFMSASITYNDTLIFSGTFDPAFQLVIMSVGNIDGSKNVIYSEKIFAFLKEKLGIPDNRGYIEFRDPGAENLGFLGTTLSNTGLL